MPKTIKHRRKWTNKYKKSINCKKPRGFSQKQYCKYGRTKKRVKKTMKGGIGENMAMNATRKFGTVLSGIGRGAINVGTGVADDSLRREALRNQYTKQMEANKYNPVKYNPVNYNNKENLGHNVDNSKLPNLSPKNSSPQILRPSPVNFTEI